VIGFGDFSSHPAALRGDGLALAGGAALALYLVSGRRLRARMSLPAYLAICYSIAALVLWACVLCAGEACVGFSGRTWAALIWMGVVNQHLGQSSYNWAMRYLSAGVVSVCLLGEPFIGSLLAWWLFGEPLSWVKAGGGLLILVGVYLAGKVQQSAPS
jgi:drug/metabolite transporter (DMT)-like permease